MQNRYENTFRLRTLDFDCNAQLKPSAILDLFQEVAGAHAEKLGIGFEKLVEKKLLWVITKVKFELLETPPMHSNVIVHTWPLEPVRVAFQREYLIESENGKPLVKGTSEWVLMHSEKRRIVAVKELYPFEEFCSEKIFESKLVKVPDFEEAESQSIVIPAFCDLDINGHVNNTKYADYVLNNVDLNQMRIHQFQIDYHREVQMGTQLLLSVKKDGKAVFAKGNSETGEKMFSCHILLK